jgi:hypothetical protein
MELVGTGSGVYLAETFVTQHGENDSSRNCGRLAAMHSASELLAKSFLYHVNQGVGQWLS